MKVIKLTSKTSKISKISELEMGIEVEKEHKDVYDILKKEYDIDWTLEEFAKKIAEAHIKELPDYYTRLKKMESESAI